MRLVVKLTRLDKEVVQGVHVKRCVYATLQELNCAVKTHLLSQPVYIVLRHCSSRLDNAFLTCRLNVLFLRCIYTVVLNLSRVLVVLIISFIR